MAVLSQPTAVVGQPMVVGATAVGLDGFFIYNLNEKGGGVLLTRNARDEERGRAFP